MRRYIFKLYPTAAQAEALHVQRMMMADLWNALKQRCEDTWRRHRGPHGVVHAEGRALPTFFDLTNEITGLRHECPEWAAIPAVTAHRVAKHLTESYAAFFRRLAAGEEPGYPRWQRREHASCIPLGTMDKTGWTLRQKRQENPYSWSLHYGGVSRSRDSSTWIRCRGVLPDKPEDWRNGDILWRDGRWWLSVCVEMAARRLPGRFPLRIEFDLLDEFVRVNGVADPLPELIRARLMQERIDALKAEHDTRWPRGRRRDEAEQMEFLVSAAEISRLSAKVARIRKNSLHVWTARIVERASAIDIVAPPVRPNTRSPRGDARQWGAHVETVAGLNRNTLNQSPALAVAMLRYKAGEAGIRCDVIADAAPNIAVGAELVRAGRTARQASRKLKRIAA